VQPIVDRCLAKNPADRYQSAAELHADLNALTPATPSSDGAKADAGNHHKRKLIFGIASIVVGIVVVIAAVKILVPGVGDEPADKLRVVVLPFDNLGAPEDEFFADGLTDAITARLTSVHSIDVISRQSAIQYKGSDKTIRQIAYELDVDYALEGTVQRERPGDPNSPIRVIPQLVRTDDDSHVWATIYDEGATELFRIQSEIAERVATALDLKLNDVERRLLASKPTANLEAYDYYLRGLSVAAKSYFGMDQVEAIPLLERAVEIDPGFTDAWAQLARKYADLVYQYQYEELGAEYQVKARDAIDRIFELDPELPEGKLANGVYYYSVFLDYDKSCSFFEEYIQKRPGAAVGYERLAYVQRRRGQWKLAARNFERAVELDPLGWDALFTLGEHYYWMRRYEKAAQCFERAIEQRPDSGPRYLQLAMAYISIDRSAERAVRTMRQAYLKAGVEQLVIAYMPVHRIITFNEDEIVDLFVQACRREGGRFIIAQLYEQRGDMETALVEFDSLRIDREAEVAVGKNLTGTHPWQYGNLAVAYASLGRKAEAIRMGRFAVERFPLSQDALFGFIALDYLAEIYVRVGEYELAIDQLELILSIPSYTSVGILMLDPLWDPLRDNPRFQALLETGP
jgi:serine/threonine-protein kinase